MHTINAKGHPTCISTCGSNGTGAGLEFHIDKIDLHQKVVSSGIESNDKTITPQGLKVVYLHLLSLSKKIADAPNWIDLNLPSFRADLSTSGYCRDSWKSAFTK